MFSISAYVVVSWEGVIREGILEDLVNPKNLEDIILQNI